MGLRVIRNTISDLNMLSGIPAQVLIGLPEGTSLNTGFIPTPVFSSKPWVFNEPVLLLDEYLIDL